MAVLRLFHGSQNLDVQPRFGLGDDRHDYGKGFYLTEDAELAKEWAVSGPDGRPGWVQGLLFDNFVQAHPGMDTAHFIRAYMKSGTRQSIDRGMAYTCAMDAVDLWLYYTKTEKYVPVPGPEIPGFLPDWIGEFYAYYQWLYEIPSATLVDAIPIEYLSAVYPGLHDLELDLAVKKVAGFMKTR